MLIDTHCHLNFPDAFPDPAAEIEAARVAGVEALVVVGIDLESSEAALRLADSFEEVHAVVGMHPNTAGEAPEGWLSQIEALARRPKAVAIGEIGLDFHWKDTPPDMQMQALLAQLDLAARLDKPIVFHCREAYDELLTVLEARGSGRYLFHCFSGDLDHARRALALGGILGVDGPITYPKSEALRELVRAVPLDRLVLETDSPFMPPVPYRSKTNHPAYLSLICDGLAQALVTTPEEVESATTRTAKAFFGI